LIEKLGICLFTPEELIFSQGDEAEEMYFIIQGDCVVNMIDYNGHNTMIRVLVEGDHMGELAYLYNCKLTCSVLSRNYNSLARLTFPRLKDLLISYPDYK
jgi:CRP-like cAMP-binding protein